MPLLLNFFHVFEDQGIDNTAPRNLILCIFYKFFPFQLIIYILSGIVNYYIKLHIFCKKNNQQFYKKFKEVKKKLKEGNSNNNATTSLKAVVTTDKIVKTKLNFNTDM